ncbi:hypothetical protein C8R44DRAFT_784017 [Mycena epipterygia]|nr:hypothetical protein C8R44DRAFT_784017 [Mycena epipterygia]
MIQEIWDHIFGFLEGQTEDLRSCALVCRAWHLSAQYHLFHTITLARIGCPNQIDKETASSFALLLCLRRSPHLVPLIRNISFILHPQVIENVSSMGL